MKTRDELKDYFNVGDRPTEQNFADLITTLATQSGANTFSADLQTFLGSISCAAVSATTFYGDGSNLDGIQAGSSAASGTSVIPFDYVVPVTIPVLPAGERLEMNFELGDIGDPESIYWTIIDGVTGLSVDQYKYRAELQGIPGINSQWAGDSTTPTVTILRQFVPAGGVQIPFNIKNQTLLYGSLAILRAYGGVDGYLRAERFGSRTKTGNYGEFYSADGSTGNQTLFPDTTALPITYQSLGFGVMGGFYNGPFSGNGPFGLNAYLSNAWAYIKSQVESFWLDRTDSANTKLVIAFKSLSTNDSRAKPATIGIILP